MHILINEIKKSFFLFSKKDTIYMLYLKKNMVTGYNNLIIKTLDESKKLSQLSFFELTN